MKNRQNSLLALLACASLAGSSAFAALNSYIGPVNGDWNAPLNWSAGVAPVTGQQPMVSSGSSVLLSNSVLNLAGLTLSVGTYMANNAGTGSVTIENSQATFGYLNMAYATTGVASSGRSGIYVNNSSLTFSLTVNVGRGNGTAGAETAELILDATSTLNAVSDVGAGQLFNVGRGTTGTLALQGNDTSGAQATVGRLILGVETNGVGMGIMGTNSKLIATRSVSVGNTVSADTSYLTMSGATLVAGNGSEPTQTNSLIVYNTGALVATNSSISAYNNMTVQTGSATIYGSSLSLGATGGSGNLLMNAGNLSLSGSTVSMAGYLQATSSSVIAAINSTISVYSNLIVGAGSAVSLTGSNLLAGATGGSGNLLMNGGNLSLNNTSASAAGYMQITNSSTLSLTGSILSVAGYMQITNSSTLSLTGASLSVGGVLYSNTGADIHLVNSSLSAGGNWLATVSSTSALGTTVTLEGSQLSLASTTFSAATQSGGRNSVTMTNSTINTSGILNLGYSALTMNNSTLSVGTNFYSQGDGGNNIQNSTISAGAFEINFSLNATTVSNSLISISSPTAVAPIRTSGYSTHLYLTNNSTVSIGTNGYLGTGHLDLGSGSSATLSMTDGTLSISTAINVGTNSGGNGYLRVNGGYASTSRVVIGQTGSGTVEVGGTGVLYAPTLSMSGNATFAGNLYIQGTQTTPITASGQATFDTMALGSGAVLTGGTVHINPTASVSFILSGTPTTFQAVQVQSLAFDGACTINVDFTNIAITEAAEIVILLADTVSGVEYNPPINTIGLDSAWQALYEGRDIGGQTALVAMITAIPEPALSALMLGALGLFAVSRRRR